ncbi:uncharacterized protein LOC135073804 isoform X2 [Ostrinia nubilalis]|uniref:uncharacterized protein LOC135073804 isoform X2 n=1 Tax=Ostrinia nubilalis TaxID=29057 RepID=UPI00308265DC
MCGSCRKGHSLAACPITISKSRDWKTNYFTQLIWAETDKVGCGRARFYVAERKSIIERLVCNFAPKGNLHGKPVYAIGFPATQCVHNKVQDQRYKGLCAHLIQDNDKPHTTPTPPVSSLLRIFNLSNNSVKLDIDPIRNNLRQMNFNESIRQRNPKTRHVFFNNSHAGLRNVPRLPMQNQWNTPANAYSQTPRVQRPQQYQQERGHSRVYHGHELHNNNFASNINDQSTSENYRRFDYTTEQAGEPAANDLRKYNRYHQCTRRSHAEESDCESSHQVNQCTRHRSTSCCQVVPTTTSCPIMTVKLGCPRDMCQCNTPRATCATMPPMCQCNSNCQCFNPDSGTQCLSGRRTQNNDDNPAIAQPNQKADTRKAAELHYYDLLPNMAIRSGDNEEDQLPTKDNIITTPKDTWLQHDTTIPDMYKRMPHKIKHDQRQVKEKFRNRDNFRHVPDYMYDSSDSRERKRRSPIDEVTFKPFWQMDEYNRDKSTQLRSMLYTTLSNKKFRKTRRTTTTVKVSQTTESITVQLKDASNMKPNPKGLVTEKYLSFDELMHLRKLSTLDTTTDARRRAAPDAATTSASSEYTANTPFMRKKHCTRKLTCTWTAPTVTNAEGSVIIPGIGGDRGSRTPPGYVEGCTRTSTCTRDFMNRNKFSSIDDSSTETTLEDEDYCEKRALNVRRRDSSFEAEPNMENQVGTDVTTFTIHSLQSYVSTDIDYISSTIPTTSIDANCFCYEETSRMKRNDNDENTNILHPSISEVKRQKRSEENLSYGDLYYLVLQKIIRTWKRGQNSFHNSVCLCNSAHLLRGSISIFLFIFLYNLIFNVFI